MRVGLAVVLAGGALAAPFAAHAGRSNDVAPCAAQVHTGVLPVWMRAGFSDDRPRVPYVLGTDGAMGAVIWLPQLHADPKGNKILWIPRTLAKRVAPLWIKLQKMDGTRLVGAPVREVVSTGPGPSHVPAPSAGCWRLTLTWSGRRDTLDLVYD